MTSSSSSISTALSSLPSSNSSSFSKISNKSKAPRLLLSKPSISVVRNVEIQGELKSTQWKKSLKIKSKECILINGRNGDVKQSIRFNTSLPLKFLSQNGNHLPVATFDRLSVTPQDSDDEVVDVQEDGNGGLTVDFLEDSDEDQGIQDDDGDLRISDIESDINEQDEEEEEEVRHISKKQKLGSTSSISTDDLLPKDFLDLLKREIPGGRKDVSPGDFARIWKKSGRGGMSNELVLAQNAYFSGDGGGGDGKKRKSVKS